MSNLSFLQNIGLKLLGADALAVIKGEVVTLTQRTIAFEQKQAPLVDVVSRVRLEDFFQTTLETRAGLGGNQITSALLAKVVGGDDPAYLITDAVRLADESGEGFMKKKAAVLKVVREVAPGLKRSAEQLAIELAVQLSKD